MTPQSPPAGEGLDAVIKHEPYGRNDSYRCLAHSEGQLCCTDPEHPDYPQLKAQLSAYILAQFLELIGGDADTLEMMKHGLLENAKFEEGKNILRAELRKAAHARFGTDKEGAEDAQRN